MARNKPLKSKCPVRKAFGADLTEHIEEAGYPHLTVLAIVSEINYHNLSNLRNGDKRRFLGPIERPWMLLGITVALMRGFVRSAIPDEEKLKEWLYMKCPDLLVNDDGREWVVEEARKELAAMNFSFSIPPGTQGVVTLSGALRSAAYAATKR